MIALPLLVAVGGLAAVLVMSKKGAASAATPPFACEFDEHMPNDVRVSLAQTLADPRTPVLVLEQLAVTMQMGGFPKASLCLANAATYAKEAGRT